ncbi:glucose 1-dehydrogenase [Phenylobacterium sp.]|jgi:NAD(P)-dependent dehydrogenase (short-subunit alcohol dehydrogenase family)|uniref:SDR family NAD(P)-dependent oxidoreductase n=1 Tax=Phenylobacterium sp. TaxID=1871053 RepID=UPI002F3E7914
MPRPTKSYDRLSGLTALVTGAGTEGGGLGIGKAIALLFAREGAKVALADIDRSRAEETLEIITRGGGEGLVVVGDVTDPEACAAMVAQTAERFGGLDLLVNNVGVVPKGGRLELIEVADWRRNVDVNFNGAFLMTRAAIPHLLSSAGKAVINIASIAGMRGYGSTSYGAAKAALIQLTRDLAVIYGPEGLRANCIAPGHMMTPMVEKLVSPQAREARRRIAPLGIEGDAWDVAQAAVYLASAEARFVTGVCLPVDGGAVEIGPLPAFHRMNQPT